MTRLRFVFPLVGFASLSILAVACSGTGDGGSGNDSGAGGADSAAGGADSAAGGADSAVGGACSDTGTGTLVLEVKGLPDGVAPDVSTTGADELALNEAGAIADLPAGTYSVTAARVFDDDPIVRTVYDATVADSEFCLADGASHTVTVTYKAIPTSNKLWMPTDMDDELAGFSSNVIAESGMTDASVSIDAPGSSAVTFDRDGNLWALGPTVADAQIARFNAADFAAAGTKTPEISLNVPEIECLPAIAGMAFDSDGNLWLSACGGSILRLPAADLTTSGDKTSDVQVTGLGVSAGIAFDKAGNLWIGGGDKLLRFDAARLSGAVDGADLALAVKSAVGDVAIKADELAFDQAGNLWAVDEGGNHIFEIAESDLSQTGDKPVKAHTSFVVGVTALPDALAFDDSNNLWISLESGFFGGFSPTQLSESHGTGAPVTPKILIGSSSVGAGLPVAFFPAPAGLPLFHSIPAP